MPCPMEKWCSELPLAIFVLIVSWYLWKYFTTPKNLPPGPWGLPIVGFFPFMGKKPHITMNKLKKKYGDIFMFSLGGCNVVVLTSYEAMKEALIKQADAFSGRPLQILSPAIHDRPGIIANDGDTWAEFRRFSLMTLKNFGFGRSSLEPQLSEEIQMFLDKVSSMKSQPFVFANLLQKSVTNVICTIISGSRLDYEDPVLNELLRLTQEQINLGGFGKLETILPVFIQRSGILDIFGKKSTLPSIEKMLEILNQIVENRTKIYRPGSQENFVDCWLTELAKGEKATHLTRKQLPSVLRDLFLAGSDTTTNTLTWGLLYMAKLPEIQKKIQNEIDQVVGRERTPAMSDQKDMPYTEATLMEIGRLTTIVPMSLLHRCTKDSIVNGYLIPKETVVIPNLWSVHSDPALFPEPDVFKPERFLTDKQQLKKMEQVIPFSIGKRQCMGESLAKMELFLYFTSILQQFTVQKAPGIALDFTYDFSVITVPKRQPLCLIPR